MCFTETKQPVDTPATQVVGGSNDPEYEDINLDDVVTATETAYEKPPMPVNYGG